MESFHPYGPGVGTIGLFYIFVITLTSSESNLVGNDGFDPNNRKVDRVDLSFFVRMIPVNQVLSTQSRPRSVYKVMNLHTRNLF